jgi:hypothetical protein
LSLKDLNWRSKKPAAKAPVYHAGPQYQHPANKELVWQGKEKKPGWLTALEADGKSAVVAAKWMNLMLGGERLPMASNRFGSRREFAARSS